MKIPAFARSPLFVIAAVGAGAISVYVLLSRPPELKVAGPALQGVLPAPATTGPESVAGSLPEPTVTDVVLEPRPAPRPGADARLAALYPPSRLPDVATAAGARISLACLARNGADLSKPMASKHHVFAATEELAARLRAWAEANGFETRNTEVLRSHTGTPEYQFDLVRVETPDPEKIEQEGRAILNAVLQMPGTYYQTWSGEIVR